MSNESRPLRIGIDGLNLAIPRGTGVATYARALGHCVGAMGHAVDVVYGLNIDAATEPPMREVQFFDLLESERGRKAPRIASYAWFAQMLRASQGLAAFEIPITGQVIATPFAHRLGHYDRILNVCDMFATAWRYFRAFGRMMPIRIDNPPDIMHWTYPVAVRLIGARNLYTVHDLVPFRMPYTTLDNKVHHRRLLDACIATGDGIVTVSETSRHDILGFFPQLAPDRITNTFQAVDPPTRTPDRAEIHNTLQGAFDLQPGGYFLFCGSIEPKKNVGRLLQAFLASGLDMPLVIVGARAWKSENELALLKHRPEHDRRVRQIDYLPAEVLATLMRGARAVVFPSLYEGFGLPMLEAMSLGTPVMTSREGSLAEIGGDAPHYIDPYDCQDMTAGLLRLAADDGLCAALRERGLARAAQFGMAAYGERVTALYRSVLERPPAAARGPV